MNIRLIFISLVLLVASLKAAEIRFSVSDLLAPQIKENIETFSEEFDVEIDFQTLGSLPATERLMGDELDIAILAIPDGHRMPSSDFTYYPIAYEVMIIAVNDDNPIAEISLDNLSGIFGSDESQDLKTWGDLGLAGWNSRNIKPLSETFDQSVCLELFKYSVLNQVALKSAVSFLSASDALKVLSTDVTAIGLLERSPKDSSVKTLMISMSASKPAYGPSVDNVHYGDYPIRLPYYIVFKKTDSEKVNVLLRHLLSNNFASSLKDEGIFTLPDAVRSQFSFELNMTAK